MTRISVPVVVLASVLTAVGCSGGGTTDGVEEPEPLLAVISAGPTEGDAPLTVNADGSASTGAPVLYEWDQDYDGMTFDVDATGETAIFNYPSFGIYTLALRVTDSEATMDIEVVTISVNTAGNVMPSASLSGTPLSGDAALLVGLDASGSFDSDGSIVWYLWDYDYDGNFTEIERTAAAVHSHTFYFPGDFTVAVKVLDDSGGWNTATIDVTVNDAVVTFPDAGLEAAVREAIDRETGDIYASDLKPVRMLNAAKTDPAMADLTNIDYLNNLVWLYASENSITDISPLANLRKLQWLYIYQNNIADLSPLSGLSRLKGVFANGNNVSDLTPVSSLPLLKDLNVSANSITDVSVLSGLSQLLSLSISENSLSGGVLPALPATLERLTASNCGLTDVSAVSSLPALGWLNISLNTPADISGAASLADLEYLNIAGCGLSILPDLSGLSSILELNAAGNPITDWTTVGSLSTLTWLNAVGCGISDISFLSALSGLEGVYLDANSISDISPLASSTGLCVISLSNNSVSDLSPMSSLLDLRFVNLDSNNVSDITALVTNSDGGGLGNGDSVVLTGNPLSAQAVNVDIPALEANGVLVTY